MTALINRCTKVVAVLGIVAAAGGCKKKDEYAGGPAGTASPAIGTEPRGVAAAGSAPLTVDVLAVDTKAPSITVTEAIAGSSTADEKEAGTTRGTAGAIADRRTLPVEPAAAAGLSRLEPGQRIDIVCAETPTPAGDAAALDPALASPLPDDPLARCTKVTAIMTPAGGVRGR
jgi:hypothetical protein